MALVTLTLDDRAVLAALNDLSARVADVSPALREIGEELLPEWKARFDTTTGPDGQRWAPNSQTTILNYLAGRAGSFGRKTGKLTSKGAGYAMAKKPLTRDGFLRDTLNYQIDGQSLLIGSPQKYAAVQQFGAQAREFGRAPWGDIPARPFLGVSESDRRGILDILQAHLAP